MEKTLYIVVGLGKTGRSLANYLKRRHQEFIFFDTRVDGNEFAAIKQEFADVNFFFQELPQKFYTQCKKILISPGIDLATPVLKYARQYDILISNDIECFAQEVQVPVIAITGTNGKSTVTTLVGKMAEAAGLQVAVAGNIGNPVLDQFDNQIHYDVWILELSSFHLELTRSLKLCAATILNISDDHLDRHHSMSEYIKAKQNIYKNTQYALYNRQDHATYPQVDNIPVINSYGLDVPAAQQWGINVVDSITYLMHGSQPIIAVNKLVLQGKHNWSNALAACALAFTIGVNYEHMIAVLTTFSGLEHRCQLVKIANQVTWINDSKGTNVGASISALHGIGSDITGKIILIAGGLGKGADFMQLRQAVADYVRTIILLGTDAEKIALAIADLVPVVLVKSMREAVSQAKFYAQIQDVVLLSPACSSLDMFQDFNHRGEVFASLVQDLG